MSQDEQPTTITAYLRPIDREGLLAFAKSGRDNPAIVEQMSQCRNPRKPY